MRTRLVVGLTIGALGMLVAACSSSSSSSTPTPPDSTPQIFCTDYASAICALSSICEFDVSNCETFQNQQCTTFANAAQATGTRTYSQPAGHACIVAMNSTYGGSPSSISGAALAALTVTCNEAFVGSVASNKPCTDDYDCVSGYTCSNIPGSTNSICGSGSAVAAGGMCLFTSQCPASTYCEAMSGAEPTCAATPATGGACSATIPCGAGDYCNGGTCQAQLAIGQTCAQNTDCLSAYCDTYPPAACTTGLTFARGAIDCNGIAGTDEGSPDAGTSTPEAGASDTGTGG
jgi:hypothetical protein